MLFLCDKKYVLVYDLVLVFFCLREGMLYIEVYYDCYVFVSQEIIVGRDKLRYMYMLVDNKGGEREK